MMKFILTIPQGYFVPNGYDPERVVTVGDTTYESKLDEFMDYIVNNNHMIVAMSFHGLVHDDFNNRMMVDMMIQIDPYAYNKEMLLHGGLPHITMEMWYGTNSMIIDKPICRLRRHYDE